MTNTDNNGELIEDEPYLSIIVDNNNNGLKRVCSIFDQHQLVCTFVYSSSFFELNFYLNR